MHGHGGAMANESPFVKFLISGSVAWTFELVVGHYLEFLKISKQTSELSYAQLTRNMIRHKGLAGVLDGYFPWGSIQCFVKGASFGFGQTLGYNLLGGRLPEFQREVVSGGVGGLVQGVVMSPLLLLKTRVMTSPEMRSCGGVVATTIASTKMGARVIAQEGPMALMKGHTPNRGTRSQPKAQMKPTHTSFCSLCRSLSLSLRLRSFFDEAHG